MISSWWAGQVIIRLDRHGVQPNTPLPPALAGHLAAAKWQSALQHLHDVEQANAVNPCVACCAALCCCCGGLCYLVNAQLEATKAINNAVNKVNSEIFSPAKLTFTIGSYTTGGEHKHTYRWLDIGITGPPVGGAGADSLHKVPPGAKAMTCGVCQKAFGVAAGHAQVRCPHCKTVVAVPGALPEATPLTSPALINGAPMPGYGGQDQNIQKGMMTPSAPSSEHMY
eukprot:g41704.t1